MGVTWSSAASAELRFADEPLAAGEEQYVDHRRRWRVVTFDRRSSGRVVVFMALSLARREHVAEAKSQVEALGVRPPTNVVRVQWGSDPRRP
jgi:hypothetical protein